MYQKEIKSWLKHADFIILDMITLQLCFIIVFFVRCGLGNPYSIAFYRNQARLLFVCQFVIDVFTSNYKNILRRARYDELVAVINHISKVLILAIVYVFIIHTSTHVSRLQLFGTCFLFVFISFLLREINKKRIFIFSANKSHIGKRSVILITSSLLVEEAMDNLTKPEVFHDFFIAAIILMDDLYKNSLNEYGIPVLTVNDDIASRISRAWVDEAFILQPDFLAYPTDLMNTLLDMGITVHYTLSAMSTGDWSKIEIHKLGEYKVLTNSLTFVSSGEIVAKRLLDILGGIAGCFLTGIIFIFVAPIIYKKSPGPIFFSQKSVGRNGRTFKIYKFRSMYMDAEERKAALMEQNKMSDGLMFKVDDDPRIIGSEKKDKNGNPKGIGNFIRNTSLDEFPQFLNVLLGQMSLVGTRPPTLDEWQNYDLSHRVRMSIKPGITGMWQVSGRSEITDFDEVVKLDREYIENWSLALDIKILLKTVLVVLKRSGAE